MATEGQATQGSIPNTYYHKDYKEKSQSKLKNDQIFVLFFRKLKIYCNINYTTCQNIF